MIDVPKLKNVFGGKAHGVKSDNDLIEQVKQTKKKDLNLLGTGKFDKTKEKLNNVFKNEKGNMLMAVKSQKNNVNPFKENTKKLNMFKIRQSKKININDYFTKTLNKKPNTVVNNYLQHKVNKKVNVDNYINKSKSGFNKINAIIAPPKGGYRKVEQIMNNRLKNQVGLSRFGDIDNDGVPNILDCRPLNYFKQGPEHNIEKKYNMSEEETESMLRSEQEARDLTPEEVESMAYTPQMINEDDDEEEEGKIKQAVKKVGDFVGQVKSNVGEKLENRREKKQMYDVLEELEEQRDVSTRRGVGERALTQVRMGLVTDPKTGITTTPEQRMSSSELEYYLQHKAEITGVPSTIDAELRARARQYIASGKSVEDAPPEVRDYIYRQLPLRTRVARGLKDVLFSQKQTPVTEKIVNKSDRVLSKLGRTSRSTKSQARKEATGGIYGGQSLAETELKTKMMTGGGFKPYGMMQMVQRGGQGFYGMLPQQKAGLPLYMKAKQLIGQKSTYGQTLKEKTEKTLGKKSIAKSVDIGPDLVKNEKEEQLLEVPIAVPVPVQPPIQPQQQMQPSIQPQQTYPATNISQQQSAGDLYVEGVQYKRMPDGKWKNMKTGNIISYPRGKYEKHKNYY